MNKTFLIFCCILALGLLSNCANKNLSTRFISNKDDTVLDEQTGLMWAAYDSRSDVPWKEAKEYCESYQGGGHNDWRMPRRDELIELQNSGIEVAGKKKVRARVKNNPIVLTDRAVWTSEKKGSEAAFCDFRFQKKKCAWMEQVISMTMRALPVRDTASDAGSASKVMSSEQVSEKLKMIKQMYEEDLMTKEEYDQKRKELLEMI